MNKLREYIQSNGKSSIPSVEYMNSIVRDYPWFSFGHQLLSHLTGKFTHHAALTLQGVRYPRFFYENYSFKEDGERTKVEIIETFLIKGGLRIIPSDEAEIEDIDNEINQDQAVPQTTQDWIETIVGEKVNNDFNRKIDTSTSNTLYFTPEEDDEFITEELAEIYMKQELYEQSKEIYSRLILIYPEKSAYFAVIIEEIDNKVDEIIN